MDETRSPYLKPIEGDIFLFHHTQAHVRILAIREGYVMLREHGKKPYLLPLADFRNAFDHVSATYARTVRLKKRLST